MERAQTGALWASPAAAAVDAQVAGSLGVPPPGAVKARSGWGFWRVFWWSILLVAVVRRVPTLRALAGDIFSGYSERLARAMALLPAPLREGVSGLLGRTHQRALPLASR